MKSESSLSFSSENTVNEGRNLRPVKTVHSNRRVPSSTQTDELLRA